MSHVPPAEPDRTPEPEPTGLIGPFDLPGPPPPPPQSVQPVQPAPAPPSRMPPDPRQDFPAYTSVPQDQRQDLAGNGGAYPRQFAPWGSRVGAWLIDRLIGIAPALVLGAIGAGLVAAGSQTDDSTGTTDFGPLAAVGFVLVGLAYLTVIVIEIWNRCIRTGRTGQSIASACSACIWSASRPASRSVPAWPSSASCATSSTASSAISAICSRCGTPSGRPWRTRSSAPS